MKSGWILYKRQKKELSDQDHGVNRLLSIADEYGVDLQVYAPQQFTVSNYCANILLNGKEVPLPDFVLPRLGAESTYHSLSIIKQLELKGVRTFNSAKAIALVKDKMLVSQILMAHGFPTPKTMLINRPMSLPLITQEIGFPLVIKNNTGARGIGISLFESPEKLTDFMDFIDPATTLIAQQFIQESYGRDLRIFVLGGRVLGSMQRVAVSGFKANYSLGGKVLPYELMPFVEKLALDCANLLGLEIGGIDLLFSADQFLICEANSSPGFKGLELATGKDIARAILEYIVQNGSRHD